MIPTCFPNEYAILENDNAPSYTTGTVQSRFEEHEEELHLL
jgi:hypothetical protein